MCMRSHVSSPILRPPGSIRTTILGCPIKVARRIHHQAADRTSSIVAASEAMERLISVAAPADAAAVDHAPVANAAVWRSTEDVAQAVDERRRERFVAVRTIETRENRISLRPGDCYQHK